MDPELTAKTELAVILGGLATHKKGIFAIWEFMASGKWSKVPGLDLERIMYIGYVLLSSLATQFQCDQARKALRKMNVGVCVSPFSLKKGC